MIEEADIAIGKRIRELRTDQGISLEQLAADASLHYNTLSIIERGERSTSIGKLSKIAKALNADLPTLVDSHQNSDRSTLQKHISSRLATLSLGQLRALMRILDALRYCKDE